MQKTVISGSCFQICGPVHRICAAQFFHCLANAASSSERLRNTHILVLVLVGVGEFLTLLAQQMRLPDFTPGIQDLRLAGPSKNFANRTR